MPASLFRERPGRTRIGSQLFSMHAASISMGQHAAIRTGGARATKPFGAIVLRSAIG